MGPWASSAVAAGRRTRYDLGSHWLESARVTPGLGGTPPAGELRSPV
jgi:hypothetical protein